MMCFCMQGFITMPNIPCYTYNATHTHYAMPHIPCHKYHATHTRHLPSHACDATHTMPHIPCHTYTQANLHTKTDAHTHIHTTYRHTDIHAYLSAYMRMYFCAYCTNVVAMLLRQTWLLANCNAFIKLFVLELHLKLTLSWVNLSGVRNEQRYLLVILRKPWFFKYFSISFVNQHPLSHEIADSSKLLECQEQWLQLWMVWHGHASSNTLRRWGPFDQSVLYSRTPKDIIFHGSTVQPYSFLLFINAQIQLQVVHPLKVNWSTRHFPKIV